MAGIPRLPDGTYVHDQVHGTVYRLEKHLGQGGFGAAYLAVRLSSAGRPIRGSETCLKFSLAADEWHGEVYFSNLLKDLRHVVQMKTAFPASVTLGRGSRIGFFIDMEYVSGGTVRDNLNEGPSGWTEKQVAFRVRQLLKPLKLLHGMGVSHRDVTPPNVFVGNKKVLKLGDFGITKAQLHPSGVHADVFNGDFAPKDVGTWWSPADDIFQVGLLMASLLAGEEIHWDVRKPEINQFTTKGPVRDAIKAAISVKAKRPKNAGEFSALLDQAYLQLN